MKKYFILPFLLLLLLLSCNGEFKQIIPSEVADDFESFKKLNVSKQFDQIKLLESGGILIKDSILFVSSFDTEIMIDCYNLNTQSKICSFLSRGKGANEMRAVAPMAIYNRDSIQIMSIKPDKDIFIYAISDILKSNTTPAKKLSISFDSVAFTGRMIATKNYTVFGIGNSKNNESRFFSYHSEMNRYTFFEKGEKRYFDNMENLIFEDMQWGYMPMSITTKPDGTKVALSLVGFSGLEVIDMKKQKIDCFKYYERPKVMIREVRGKRAIWFDEDKKTFRMLQADDNYIYTLYSNKKRTEENFSLGKYIYVYTWDLKPVKKYELASELKEISIDKNYLYGLEYVESEEDSYYIVVRYDL